jgi:hypothetical protein
MRIRPAFKHVLLGPAFYLSVALCRPRMHSIGILPICRPLSPSVSPFLFLSLIPTSPVQIPFPASFYPSLPPVSSPLCRRTGTRLDMVDEDCLTQKGFDPALCGFKVRPFPALSQACMFHLQRSLKLQRPHPSPPTPARLSSKRPFPCILPLLHPSLLSLCSAPPSLPLCCIRSCTGRGHYRRGCNVSIRKHWRRALSHWTTQALLHVRASESKFSSQSCLSL